ncbi:unnamed protein product [Amaranthus hypochondriacus]
MNMIRCCLSCILPCGALDVIRIIHTNGRVEEISGTIRAEEVMKAHPKHILKKPTSRPNDVVQALDRGPTIVVVPPHAQLQRGKIYFLIPVHDHQKKSKSSSSSSSSPLINASRGSTARRKQKMISSNPISLKGANLGLANGDGDKYLSDILSEKVIHREKRRGRVAVWRPHLDSICETHSETASTN